MSNREMSWVGKKIIAEGTRLINPYISLPSSIVKRNCFSTACSVHWLLLGFKVKTHHPAFTSTHLRMRHKLFLPIKPNKLFSDTACLDFTNQLIPKSFWGVFDTILQFFTFLSIVWGESPCGPEWIMWLSDIEHFNCTETTAIDQHVSIVPVNVWA